MAVQPAFDFHNRSPPHSCHRRSIQDAFGAATPPVAGCARAYALWHSQVPAARRDVYYDASRTCGQGAVVIFVLRWRLHPLHAKFKSLRIEDFIRLRPERQNWQCRLLAGIGTAGICDERVLDAAKENLTRSFAVVGLSERFEESLLLMITSFGWKVPFYDNRKVFKNPPATDAGVIDFIHDHNRLDAELYDFAKNVFEDALRSKADMIEQASATSRSYPKPGVLKTFCHRSVGAGRFLLSKAVSAL